MKINKFENNKIKNSKTDHQINDYVIVFGFSKNDPLYDENLASFLTTSIGKIILKKRDIITSEYNYAVEYSNIPNDIQFHFAQNVHWFKKVMFNYISKNKKDLEVILTGKKFGL